MGLLESLLGSVWSKATKDWTFGRIDPARIQARYAAPERPLASGKEYVNVTLRSMRITHVQKAASTYFGAVHSFISLYHPLAKDNANDFHVFTAPSELKSLDEANLNRVIQGDQRLLGPTPYLGGDLHVEMALFSVKSADLSAPFVSLLGALSETAGTAFLGPAAPLLPLLKTGVKSLTEAPGTVTLEIGIDREFPAPTTGCYVAARAPVGTKVEAFSIGPEGALLDGNGNGVTEYPYLVFTIEGTNNRHDWAKVPDAAEPYSALLQAARKGDQKEAASLFEELKRRIRLSFDLVPDDAEAIIQWVDAQLKRALPGAMQARAANLRAGGKAAQQLMEPLESLPLYRR